MAEKRLVLATRNRKKRAEIEAILEGLQVEILTMDDFPEVPEPVEDGESFVENARKKALFVARKTGHLSLADDSGLEVDALGGRPGVRSARYAGEAGGDDRDLANNKKLLEELHGVAPAERTARFHCAMVLASPTGVVGEASGVVEGRILEERRGKAGFGYDPVFFHPPSEKTFAELRGDEKNRVSHRSRALEALRPLLIRTFSGPA